MGGGTGLIGDPSGSPLNGPLLSKSRSARSAAATRSIGALPRIAPDPPPHSCSTTPKWLAEQHLIDFLRTSGSISRSRQLQKDL